MQQNSRKELYMSIHESDINTIAMEVILNAGKGRDCIDQALEVIAKFDFDQADNLLQEAEQNVLKAHVIQTNVIQSQASGEDLEYSLLFIHAQDTIMTINTELRLVKRLLPILKVMNQKIDK